MGGTDKKNQPPRKSEDRVGQSSPVPAEKNDSLHDDVDDGDIATPKQDRTGEDDQPL